MDDSLAQGAWQLDPETRAAMRIDRVRQAVDRLSWSDVILEAEELLDEDPDHTEGLSLLGEALLEIGDHELARQVFEHRVSIEGDPESLSGLAVTAFQCVDLPTAAASAREAIRIDPGHARAHYILGLVLERSKGRQAEALTALSAASHLDPARYPLPIIVRSSEWDEVISRAVALLPAPLQRFYDGLSVRIEELPSLEDLSAVVPPLPPTIGALYIGDPPEEGDPSEARPAAVRLFARNLARAGSIEAMISELAYTLREEALDWMGLELDSLDDSLDEGADEGPDENPDDGEDLDS